MKKPVEKLTAHRDIYYFGQFANCNDRAEQVSQNVSSACTLEEQTAGKSRSRSAAEKYISDNFLKLES
jgi:hypothetical protein